jgi:hypothetical protein
VKKIIYCLGIAGIAFFLMPMNCSLAEDKEAPSGTVEIIAQGRRYKSIREYKREQIKTAFASILSSKDFREFSEDELTAIIKEIYHESGPGGSGEQGEGFTGPRTEIKDVLDSEALQRQKTLKDHLKEYEAVDPSEINSDQMKKIMREEDPVFADIPGE